MAEVPPRYLLAYLGRREPGRVALLRFPPGVTLEDAGYDWRSVVSPYHDPLLAARVVERLRGLGVEVVAVGQEAEMEAFELARAKTRDADPRAFVEDYLGANARLGGERCVTVEDYSMHTYVGHEALAGALRLHLLRRGGVRMYGDAAFREGGLPGVLGLRVENVAIYELRAPTMSVRAPCLLHGGMCGRYAGRWLDPGLAIDDIVPPQYQRVRVAVPRRLLDELGEARGGGDRRRFARGALPVVRLVLDALPGGAWRDAPFWRHLAPVVAITEARTCEEHAMLVGALQKCRSLGEMARRARDTSWAVSRALEGLRDRW